MSLPSWLRKPSPRAGDIWLTLLVALLVLPGTIAEADGDEVVLATVLGVAAVLPLLIRRRAPFLALGLITLTALLPPVDGAYTLPLAVALYTIGSRYSWQTTLAAAGAVVLVGVVYRLAGGPEFRDGDLVGLALLCAVGSAIGLYVGSRRANAIALRERAVADERLRIAQELHDVVAHNVSLIVVQAQALGATADDERVREATDGIADLGRQAMTEMHRTLKLLRGDEQEPAALAPQPGLGELPELLERARTAGVGIELAVEGEPRPLARERRPVRLPDRAGGARRTSSSTPAPRRPRSRSATAPTRSSSRSPTAATAPPLPPARAATASSGCASARRCSAAR